MACRTWEQYEQYLIQQWPLTCREVQIAIECIKGHSNKETAFKLGIAAETVHKTLDKIYRTIGVNSRYQLLADLLIADIDATPLQQSLMLAGEGAELVAAGFMSTINSYRANKKRPRSGTFVARGSKNTLTQSSTQKKAKRQAVKNPKEIAAVARAGPTVHQLSSTEKESYSSDTKLALE